MKTSGALLICLLSTSQASALTIFATAARNVSDCGFGIGCVFDGMGDQVSLANYPWLGAGIFLSGASGQNGTARFQMEFDLTGVSQPIATAFLVLNSDFETNQTLDTEFFHVTADEDGVITANDFQSAVEPTGIVQPPILANETHMYDVTSFVVQDVLAGFTYTSYQGRVDEDADTKFRRGVEYFSLSLDPAINDDPALHPRLVITFVPEPSSMLMLGGAIALLALRRRRSLRRL